MSSFIHNHSGKLLGVVIAAVVIGVILFPGFHAVPAGNKGVILNYGKVIGTANEGLYIWSPWYSQSVVDIPTQTLKFEDPHADAASKDLQQVSTKVAINYHLDSSKVQEIYATLNMGWEDRVIRPNLQEVVKSATAQYTAEEVITKRPLVQADVFNGLVERTKPYGIIIEAINIVDFQFSNSFSKAIEDKVTAEQKALEEKNKLETVKMLAEQRIAESEGIAKSTMMIASGEANATVIRAQGQTEANRLLNSQLTPQLLELKKIEKWSGNLPYYQGSANSPVIIDLGNATNVGK